MNYLSRVYAYTATFLQHVRLNNIQTIYMSIQRYIDLLHTRTIMRRKKDKKYSKNPKNKIITSSPIHPIVKHRIQSFRFTTINKTPISSSSFSYNNINTDQSIEQCITGDVDRTSIRKFETSKQHRDETYRLRGRNSWDKTKARGREKYERSEKEQRVEDEHARTVSLKCN